MYSRLGARHYACVLIVLVLCSCASGYWDCGISVANANSVIPLNLDT